jgi:cell division protein FtsB
VRAAGLTTRAAALGLVVCALVMSAALPLREYLAQRSRIAQLQQSQQAQQGRVAALEKQRALLADPTYVASLARERLHYVKPGETTYVVLGPATAPAPVTTEGQAPPVGGSAPWWSQLWGTTRSADRAGQ